MGDDDTKQALFHHWRVGFGYKGEDETDWQRLEQAVSKSIARHLKLPSGAADSVPVVVSHLTRACLNDFRFAAYRFRTDYATERREADIRDYSSRTIKNELELCRQILQALDLVDTLGIDFGKKAQPLREALQEYNNYLRSRPARTREAKRPKGKALGTLVLTLANRWTHYTKTDARGEGWKDVLTCALKAASYVPNYRGGDGEISDPAKLLRTARKNCAGEMLYLLADNSALAPLLTPRAKWRARQGNI